MLYNDWHSFNPYMLNRYKSLNVNISVDLATMNKAYHKISLLHHPDERLHLPVAECTQREQLFKIANVAFEVLSDSYKRKVYDQNLSVNQTTPKQPENKPASR